jgi:hypothetical protein
MKDSGNRTANVLIPVSDSEIAQLKERAAGKPLEDFVRELLLKEPDGDSVGGEEVATLAEELATIGEGLDEAVRLAESGRLSSSPRSYPQTAR